MAEVIAQYDTFTEGHWGNLGPRSASDKQWGGINVLLTRQGNLTPVCASRALTFSNDTVGKVWGSYWAWGVDGHIYFIQQDGPAVTYSVKAFDPDPTSIPLAQTTIGTITGPLLYEPDWVGLIDTVYITVYGDKSYVITPSSSAMTTLTGGYGNAPAGRAMCMFGERLCVGGISDARFGSVPNRIHFSGDDTNNDPTNRNAWEDLNFFDVGADGTAVAAMVPLRDYLVVLLADQQIWIVTGVPGVNATARRMYGLHKGKGGSTNTRPSHIVADPAQTRVWLYDHTYRGPGRFNGASFQRVNQFGTPNSDRTADNTVNGATTPLGGADEFLMHGVAASRAAGEGVIGQELELIRFNGVYALVNRDVIAARS